MVNSAPWGGLAFPQVNWRAGIGEALGEGVVADRTGTAVATAAGTDTEVDIRAHRVLIQGVECDLDATSIDVADVGSNPTSGQQRIDRIVWRYDPTAKAVTLVCVPGTPATTGSANPPTLTRSTTGTWDVSIAKVTRTGTGAVLSNGVTREHAWQGPYMGQYPTASALPSNAPQGATAWVGNDLYQRVWTGSSMGWQSESSPAWLPVSHGPGASSGLFCRAVAGRLDFMGSVTKLNYPSSSDPTAFSTSGFDVIGLVAPAPSNDRHTVCRMLTASYGGGMVEVAADGNVSVKAPAGASSQTASFDGVWVAL